MSWGIKIAILYGGFVALIVSLVVATGFKRSELVADDYYRQETDYQKRLDAMQATAALAEPLHLQRQDGQLVLVFPQAFNGQQLSGSIHFYAAAKAAADRIINFRITGNRYVVATASLPQARYEVQVSWQSGGRSYYQALPLAL